MSSKDFQIAAESINYTGNKLLQYLKEFQEGIRASGGDVKELQNIENNIASSLKALREQKYQVAVVAAMKAGKSTFLNSLIGVDILASETAACTVCRTDVKHITEGQPKLLEYREGSRKPVELALGGSEIQPTFLNRTREIREKGNPDLTTRFEIEHPIEAISSLSYLTGFTLVDTPGPNEWDSVNFSTVSLKQTALEALRTCNVILFVLNYGSYKDNAVSDLFKEVIEKRQELFTENQDKVYFILNKVDQKTEKDRDIPDVIQDLKRELGKFGFPNPSIYPASSFQGLLAKLIANDKATDDQIEEFENKFYMSCAKKYKKEKNDKRWPECKEIAPQALIDSGIPAIQETVIQTIIQNAGWNLLSDVLAKIDKSAKAMEDNLNLQIRGWETELEELKQKVESYRQRSKSAQKNVERVKRSVDLEKKVLTQGFSQGLNIFAESAKDKIQEEIDGIVSRSPQTAKPQVSRSNEVTIAPQQQSSSVDLGDIILRGIVKVGSSMFQGISSFLREGVRFGFEVTSHLFDDLQKNVPNFNSYSSNETSNKSHDPYKIRVNTKTEADKFSQTINNFVAPHIQNWWIDIQDQLVREGTKIRQQLSGRIKNDIQEISNELSDYLGGALQVELNINQIQFPSFEFPGIDAQIKHQQEVYQRMRKETRWTSRCCASDESYQVDVPYKETQEFYEIDLRETAKLIKSRIDEQKAINEQLLNRVIEKQITDDFRSAEKQINDYINRFQSEFDRILKERETKETEAPEIREKLENQKAELSKYLQELANIKKSLETWRPKLK